MTCKNVFVLILAAGLLASCTIVRHGSPEDQRAQAGQPSSNGAGFDAEAFVAQAWEARVVPEAEKDAVDLKTVLDGLAADPEKARTQYGRRKEDASPYAFLVKVTAPVTAVNTESSAATAELGLQAPSPEGKVLVQIGPVLKTSAVRDSLSFLSFGDFTNQVDWANISRALNFHVRDQVLKGLDREALKGKTVTLVGAFLEDEGGNVLITPVVWK